MDELTDYKKYFVCVRCLRLGVMDGVRQWDFHTWEWERTFTPERGDFQASRCNTLSVDGSCEGLP